MTKFATLALAAYAAWAAEQARRGIARERIARLTRPETVTPVSTGVRSRIYVDGKPATSSDAIEALRRSAAQSGRLA